MAAAKAKIDPTVKHAPLLFDWLEAALMRYARELDEATLTNEQLELAVAQFAANFVASFIGSTYPDSQQERLDNARAIMRYVTTLVAEQLQPGRESVTHGKPPSEH